MKELPDLIAREFVAAAEKHKESGNTEKLDAVYELLGRIMAKLRDSEAAK